MFKMDVPLVLALRAAQGIFAAIILGLEAYGTNLQRRDIQKVIHGDNLADRM